MLKNTIDFNKQKLRSNADPYYAIGFPVIPKFFVTERTIWAINEQLSGQAPLVVTKASTLKYGIINRQHYAETSQGMSDSPVISFSPTTKKINILRVVQEGFCGKNYLLTF
ncbi:MAG: hypothetical protein HEEMFOPI_01897 [Holosporales bacterium]